MSIHLELHKMAYKVMDNIKSSNKNEAVKNAKQARELSKTIIDMFNQIKKETNSLSQKNENVF